MPSKQIIFTYPDVIPAGGYRFRYRVQGSTGVYSTVTGGQSPFTIDNLANNTTYEYIFDSDCGDGTFSLDKKTGLFTVGTAATTTVAPTTTVPPTTAPSGDQLGTPNLIATPISYEHVNLTVSDDVPNAVTYTFEQSDDGGATWHVLLVSTSKVFNVHDLAAQTVYSFRVRASAPNHSDSSYDTRTIRTLTLLGGTLGCPNITSISDSTTKPAANYSYPSDVDGAIVLLTMGEFNLTGSALRDAANEVEPSNHVYEYKPISNIMTALVNPTGDDMFRTIATDVSMMPAMATYLRIATGRKVIVVCCSRTDLTLDQLQPDSTTNGNVISPITMSETNDYGRAKDSLAKCLTYCAANGINVAHKFCIFGQGEADTAAPAGYAAKLSSTVNLIKSDIGVERIFAYRTGYIQFRTAEVAESIMLQQKQVNVQNANYILTTYAPSTFTVDNGKARFDYPASYSVLGLNVVAKATSDAIVGWINTGNKPTLGTDPVTSLRGQADA